MKRLTSVVEFEKLKEQLIKERKAVKPCITVCCGTGCTASGGRGVFNVFLEKIKEKGLDIKVDTKATGCHGFCEKGPLVVIFPKRIFYQKVAADDVSEIINRTIIKGEIIERLLYVDPRTDLTIVTEQEVPFYKLQKRLIFKYNGLIDPNNIDDYIALDGYSALAKTLQQMTPEQVIEEISKSGLRGRGGAGFPTGRKWAICRNFPGDVKYIICNGDEGDPGAFQDRSLLEGNPHSVLEGMIIGAYAIGAKEGYIYVRTEYPLAVKNISMAIEQARNYGLLGNNILGLGFSLNINVFQGAGAFVCGEETALLASIEGRVGEPRYRPPYPAEKGLWDKPTVINNVKTLASVSYIISNGADWFAHIGTETSKGTMIFSLVGKINNTGLVEVPMGITLRELVFEIGGGIPKGKKLKAVQTGGPSGGCIPAHLTNLPVDYEALTHAGSMMGSGGMIVTDETTCMVDFAKYFVNFLKDESCGKCTSCREGLIQMHHILTEITEGGGAESHLQLLEELSQYIVDASMCALGRTAPNPVLSTLRYFRDEYEAHIKYKRCPAIVCKDITFCSCKYNCPVGTDVPAFVALISHGRYEEAFEIIRKENPFPIVCSYICHHPCEERCRAGEVGDSISIKNLKRFVCDHQLKKGVRPKFVPKVKENKKKKVAIIGAGPAGLACAYDLVTFGYDPTIFDEAPSPGGMVLAAIPDFRLPKHLLDLEIDLIKEAGVKIKMNTRVGVDISIDDIFKQDYEAIFIATGAHKSLKLGIPGEDAKGVIDGLELLKSKQSKKEIKIGKIVGVIGGGNTAIDVARTAWRLGCERVFVLYRRTKEEMPAMKTEVEAALEEGIKIQFLTAPVKIISQNDELTGIECVRMQLGDLDASGRRRPIPIQGSEFIINLDTLIPAVGQEPNLSYLPQNYKFKISTRNTLLVNSETLETDHPGIFAGGDCVLGPSTIADSIAQGKLAAISIDKYLRGASLMRIYEVTRPSTYVEPVKLTDEEIEKLNRAGRPVMLCIPVDKRKNNFKDFVLGLTEDMAVKEARRCLRCDLEKTANQKVETKEATSSI